MPSDEDRTLTFTAEALRVFYAVDELLHDVQRWVETGDWMETFPDIMPSSPAGVVEHKLMLRRVEEMRLSWSRSIIGLVQLAGGFGNLRVVKDGDYSLAFIQPDSGFCGGVILHRLYVEGKQTKLGTWSINT